MKYKIAITSSDGKNVDLSFGATDRFYIYEVEGEQFRLAETRIWSGEESGSEQNTASCEKKQGCGSGNGCGSGGSGCGGADQHSAKVESIKDCRCIICSKIGFQVRKQLEKKAITPFDVEVGVEEALKKVVLYFDKVDKHVTLRNSQKK